ncbi:hypothetical protein Q4512_08350 [Oceanihabitans sp. 2_MG-2023]|uniref:hypothetical protein n=1 Tax=Oceanihabitans sp. 2_MG-2023 TaxID=3062661 RepID=UPI0026E1AF34|nr:hypothetical protein [Oceanihabitans sp. 2_MG-2023]MDO6596924.1 hypothetical protein [Oceanihabitans sp. 2_MG-2023]
MKKQLMYLVLCIGLLVFNCKDENKTEALVNETEIETKKEVVKLLSEEERMEIVEYYLKNYSNNPVAFKEIVFLNDSLSQVKVILNKKFKATQTFKFSDAFRFYNANKK